MAAMKLHLLLLLSLIAFRARAEIGGSVIFFDSPDQKFIRDNSMAEGNELSANEVAATISVLLGSTPVLLSADSSSKLNGVLFPNPFDRPRAVFMLEVTGIKDPLLVSAFSNYKVSNAYSGRIVGSSKADVELSAEDEIFHLDEPLSVDCDVACIAQELAYLGGTYDGVLNFLLPSGSILNLHFNKESDRSFAISLVSLIRNIKKALENHEVIAGSIVSPAELLIGRFTGIEALEKEYPSKTVQQGLELLQTAVAKSFEELQKSYGGKMVGAVLFNRESSANTGPVLNVKVSPREVRWLAELDPINITTIAEVVLVRRTLAWITGIILLISTIMGTCCLLNMPLTRDTLLYSNVKLD